MAWRCGVGMVLRDGGDIARRKRRNSSTPTALLKCCVLQLLERHTKPLLLLPSYGAAAMAPRKRRLLYCAPSRHTTAVSAGVYVGLQTGQLVAASCTEIIRKNICEPQSTDCL